MATSRKSVAMRKMQRNQARVRKAEKAAEGRDIRAVRAFYRLPASLRRQVSAKSWNKTWNESAEVRKERDRLGNVDTVQRLKEMIADEKRRHGNSLDAALLRDFLAIENRRKSKKR